MQIAESSNNFITYKHKHDQVFLNNSTLYYKNGNIKYSGNFQII